MSAKRSSSREIRSDAELAPLIERIVRSAGGGAVICAIERGGLYRILLEAAGDLRLNSAGATTSWRQSRLRGVVTEPGFAEVGGTAHGEDP